MVEEYLRGVILDTSYSLSFKDKDIRVPLDKSKLIITSNYDTIYFDFNNFNFNYIENTPAELRDLNVSKIVQALYLANNYSQNVLVKGPSFFVGYNSTLSKEIIKIKSSFMQELLNYNLCLSNICRIEADYLCQLLKIEDYLFEVLT